LIDKLWNTGESAMNFFRFGRKWLAPMLLAGTAFATVSGTAEAAAPVQASCKLQSAGNKIKRIVHLQFDNVHLRRDNPNVPSDLEQMPHLLNFLLENGTVSGNHFTPLISHTAVDIVTTLTGVYGNRFGWGVGNSYGYFRPDGSVGNQSSFLYWTATAGDGHAQMTDELGKIAPAPWVPYTRAGCDVAGFSTANIEFERLPADIITVYGANSPEAAEANANFDMAVADFEGIALHCAQNSLLCAAAGTHAKPDLLPDEPGGYTGFNAIFGNKYLQPVINPKGPVLDLDGNVIANVVTDDNGNVTGTFPGFPGFDPSASQALGYVATLLEAGVPVVYFYIADVHDNNGIGNTLSTEQTFGPGEAPYVKQLQMYDAAFAKFFARLEADGITKDNTLFIVTADENDHFVGGPPSPPNCDGIHVPCTYKNVGEIDTYIDRLLLTERQNTTPFFLHFDDAPNFYINGNPAPTAPVTRTLEHDVNALTAVNPITGKTDRLSALLADRAEMNLLHMIPSIADRAPTFTMFGNDNYFNMTSSASSGKGKDCSQPPACVFEENGNAWNHGDFQKQITRTWFGMVGPGVKEQGRTDSVFSDHTDLRPTILALAGLKDDYMSDGRVLVEDLEHHVLPDSLRDSFFTYVALAEAYKQINATKGSVGVNSLVYANRSITSDDATYTKYLTTIGAITTERDQLASQMKMLLNDAAFANKSIRWNDTAEDLVEQAWKLVDKVEDLADRGH
jgi:arylsulfatase A-like enzyme